MSIDTSSTRSSHGFLLHTYPSPFILDGVRWRSVDHYLRNNEGADPIPAIHAKFSQNPQLGIKLERTLPNDLHVEDYGPDLMYVRNMLELPRQAMNKDMIEVATVNLSNIIREMGYRMDENLPTRTSVGLRFSGEAGDLIVDIYVDEEYPESRLREVIAANERLAVRDRPRYIVMANIARKDLTSIMDRISTYTNITFHSPSSLFAITNKHHLTPRTRLVPKDDPIYNDIVGMALPEIGVDDPLVKMLGYDIGDIIEVMDFSPHYRRVV